MKLLFKLLIIAAVLVCGYLLSQSQVINLYLISPIVTAMLAVIGSLGCLFWFWCKLIKWARKRKAGAVVFGALMQMFLPDPYAERTIKIVQECKYENKKQQQNMDKFHDD